MHQNELNRAVARATGESVRTVARMGFIPLTPMPIDRDPLVVDWDELEAQRVGVPGRVRLRVEYHAPGDDPPEEISVPWEFLADCEARRQDPRRVQAFFVQRPVPGREPREAPGQYRGGPARHAGRQ